MNAARGAGGFNRRVRYSSTHLYLSERLLLRTKRLSRLSVALSDSNATDPTEESSTCTRRTTSFAAAPRERPTSISTLNIPGIVHVSSNFQGIEFNFDEREERIRRAKISRETRGEQEEEQEEEGAAKEISFPRRARDPRDRFPADGRESAARESHRRDDEKVKKAARGGGVGGEKKVRRDEDEDDVDAKRLEARREELMLPHQGYISVRKVRWLARVHRGTY